MKHVELTALSLALLSSLWAGCALKEEKCPCPHPGLDSLSDEEITAMVDAAVEEELIEEGKAEKILKKTLKGSTKFLGHERTDFGYPPGALTIEPNPPARCQPFTVRWRIGYDWLACNVPASFDLESGDFAETLTIEPEGVEATEADGVRIESFTRASVSVSDGYVDFEYEHPGVSLDVLWLVKVAWSGDEPVDCHENTPEETFNNVVGTQFIPTCPCDVYEFYDLRVSTDGTEALQYSDSRLSLFWFLRLDWAACEEGTPAGNLDLTETVTIRRVSDGVVVVDEPTHTAAHMGSALGGSYSVVDLEPGVEYEATVTALLEGGDCGCIGDFEANNSSSLTFVR